MYAMYFWTQSVSHILAAGVAETGRMYRHARRSGALSELVLGGLSTTTMVMVGVSVVLEMIAL